MDGFVEVAKSYFNSKEWDCMGPTIQGKYAQCCYIYHVCCELGINVAIPDFMNESTNEEIYFLDMSHSIKTEDGIIPSNNQSNSEPSNLNHQGGVMDNVDDIKNLVLRISSKIENLHTKMDSVNTGRSKHVSSTPKLHKLYARLPMKTLKELDEMERHLSFVENGRSLNDFLKTFSGSSIGYITRSVLRKLFSDTLASKLDWEGLDKKRVFKHLYLCNVIICSIYENPCLYNEQIPSEEIIQIIKNWLGHATTRYEYIKQIRSHLTLTRKTQKNNVDNTNKHKSSAKRKRI